MSRKPRRYTTSSAALNARCRCLPANAPRTQTDPPPKAAERTKERLHNHTPGRGIHCDKTTLQTFVVVFPSQLLIFYRYVRMRAPLLVQLRGASCHHRPSSSNCNPTPTALQACPPQPTQLSTPYTAVCGQAQRHAEALTNWPVTNSRGSIASLPSGRSVPR